MAPTPREYVTDTRNVKNGFLGLSAFVLIAFLVTGFIGHQPLRKNIVTSLIISVGMLAFLWTYGTLWIFDRQYFLSEDGVRLSRRGQVVEEIRWEDVKRLAGGNLRIVANDGRRITFNLPPAVQREIRTLIKEKLKTYETDS